MFVRWQNYKSVARRHWRKNEPPITRCRAVLVESIRIKGKPRLKHIAFLASYQPHWLDRSFHNREFAERMYLGVRASFWRDARQRLDRLGNRITREDRSKIEAALALKVPLLTSEEEEENRRRRIELGIAPL
jgi:hypothetical protein